MRRTEPVALRSAILSAFLFCVTVCPPGAAADPASPPGNKGAAAPKPKTVARIPGGAIFAFQQLDGSAICRAAGGTFLSIGDPHRWSPLQRLSPEGHDACCWLVGGDRTRFFIANGDPSAKPRQIGGGDYTLDAIDADGKAVLTGQRVFNGQCAFASGDIGVLSFTADAPRTAAPGTAGRREVLLTVDGAATWKPTLSSVIDGETEWITSLAWVSPTRLVAGVSGAAALTCVRLYDVDRAGAVRRLWAAKVSRATERFVLDGDAVWACSDSRDPVNPRLCERVRLADGQPDGTVKLDAPARGMAACHGHLLVWGFSKYDGPDPYRMFKTEEARAAFEREEAAHAPKPQLDIWAPDPKRGYVRRAHIASPAIAGILPLKAPLCLAITASGEGLHLDMVRGKLTPVALEVTPPPPPPVNLNLATQEELKAMNELAARIPRIDRPAIFRAVNERADLTPRQRVELATKQLREYIETKKPGPIIDPVPLTEEEMRTERGLAKQVPVAEQEAAIDEAEKKTKLTDRERHHWIIKKYREYLATHKPDPDVNRTDATHDERGAMYELSGKVPDADRNAIFAEQSKKTGMTDLEKTRWATEQFRKYIDAHKAKDNKETKKEPKE